MWVKCQNVKKVFNTAKEEEEEERDGKSEMQPKITKSVPGCSLAG